MGIEGECTAEDALVIAEKDEGHLAGYCDCGAQLEAAAEPVVLRCFDHVCDRLSTASSIQLVTNYERVACQSLQRRVGVV
jgi:hypothetical protein